jgi:hypothetical protein
LFGQNHHPHRKNKSLWYGLKKKTFKFYKKNDRLARVYKPCSWTNNDEWRRLKVRALASPSFTLTVHNNYYDDKTIMMFVTPTGNKNNRRLVDNADAVDDTAKTRVTYGNGRIKNNVSGTVRLTLWRRLLASAPSAASTPGTRAAPKKHDRSVRVHSMNDVRLCTQAPHVKCYRSNTQIRRDAVIITSLKQELASFYDRYEITRLSGLQIYFITSAKVSD